MNALVKMSNGADSIQYLNIPEPTPGKWDIKVKVFACGICGTDIHLMNDTYPCHPPVVLGHEISGTVTEVGDAVHTFQPGDRVITLTAVETCETCEWCLSGRRMLCEERKSIGSGRDGGFAEYIVVPAKHAFHVPEEVSMTEAALCEPLACVCRGLCEQTSITAGDYVLIAGAGIMGQLAAQVAAANGAVVIMTGLSGDAKRLSLAKKMGVRATVLADAGDPAKKILELTDGKGPQIAVECSGAESSANLCLKALRKTGTYIQIAIPGKEISLDMDLALYKELRILSSYASEHTSWEIALRLLRYNSVQTAPLVSAILPMTEWREGFLRTEQKRALKVLLKPDPTMPDCMNKRAIRKTAAKMRAERGYFNEDTSR